MSEFLEPKQVEIDGCSFILSKFPAVEGREIYAKYTSSNVPKLGQYEASEAIMLKMMTYVQRIPADGSDPVRLQTKALVNNHVPNWEILAKLEWAMLQYNFSFFQNGKALDFFEKLKVLAQSEVTKILTAFLGKSLPAGKQPSKN